MSNTFYKKITATILIGSAFLFCGIGSVFAVQPTVEQLTTASNNIGIASANLSKAQSDVTNGVAGAISALIVAQTAFSKADADMNLLTGGAANSATEAQTPVTVQSVGANPGTLNTNTINTDSTDVTKSFGLECGILSSSATLIDCIPVTAYYLIYKPTSWLLIGSLYIFDAVLSLSIDSHFINKDFVNTLWLTARDFANMAFIFILLYAGIMTMLGSYNWKKTVFHVIVMALLLNFSLFFSKIIIDAGNVFAVGIYSQMGDISSKPHASGSIPERDIAESIAGAFQPQSFVGALNGNSVSPMDSTTVFLISAFVSLAIAWAFFKAGMLFIGRIIGFWFLMIISPIAFVSIAFPKANQFNTWLKELIHLSFVAPIFLFFIYLIMNAVNTGNGIFSSFISSSGTNVTGFLFDKLFVPVVIAIIIWWAIEKSVKYATSMAGSFGELGAKIGGAVVGTAALVATGGAGIVGRGLVGGGARLIEKSGALKKLAGSSSRGNQFLGRVGMNLTDKLGKASFDARNVPLVQKGLKKAGVDAGKGGGKGGYIGESDARLKAQKEKDLAFAKRLEMSGEEKEKITREVDPRYKKAKGGLGSQIAEKEGALRDEAMLKQTLDKVDTQSDSLPEKQAVNKAQDDLEKINKKVSEAEEKLSKAQQGQPLDPISGEPVPTPELEQAIREQTEAIKKRTQAETALSQASVAFEKTEGGQAVNKARLALERATEKTKETSKKLNETEEIIRNAETTAKGYIETEVSARRANYANYVENSFTRVNERSTVGGRQHARTTAAMIRVGNVETKSKKDKLAEAAAEYTAEKAAKKAANEGVVAEETSGGGDAHA